ncbi:Hypothetical predicted protein, partial [Paramuricea clavata]
MTSEHKENKPSHKTTSSQQKPISKSLLRKLAYFNRSTADALESEYGSDKINRQYTLLKTKLDEAYDLIQTIQGLKLDSDESDEAIDQWTQERKLQ